VWVAALIVQNGHSALEHKNDNNVLSAHSLKTGNGWMNCWMLTNRCVERHCTILHFYIKRPITNIWIDWFSAFQNWVQLFSSTAWEKTSNSIAEKKNLRITLLACRRTCEGLLLLHRRRIIIANLKFIITNRDHVHSSSKTPYTVLYSNLVVTLDHGTIAENSGSAFQACVP